MRIYHLLYTYNEQISQVRRYTKESAFIPTLVHLVTLPDNSLHWVCIRTPEWLFKLLHTHTHTLDIPS